MEFEEHNLWVELTKTPRPHEVVPLPVKKPGTEEPIGNVIMVLLTSEENMMIKKEAGEKVRQIYKETPILKQQEMTRDVESLYNDFCSIGILYRSCKRADDITKPFFRNKESIPKLLTMDQIAVLCMHYYTMLYKYGPQLQTMSEADLFEWTKKIQEDVGVDPSFLLNLVSSEALKTLAISLASQLKTLQMANSSSSEQPENGSPTNENPSKETL